MGRFAPSPTGPLHFGSLLAAVASFYEARAHAGRWLVRVEDIDPPRAQEGSVDLILAALEAYGLEWDGRISYQSNSREAHELAIQQLLDADVAYPCGCSRTDLKDAPSGPLGAIYPGTCRQGTDAAETAFRVRTTDQPIAFDDRLQGRQVQHLESESGDFVVLRKDGLIAYHLAVVVDDHLQGITDIVRGIDLMDSTPRQIWLQRLLDYTESRYAHIPIATNAAQEKLSKSSDAAAIDAKNPCPTLIAALEMLQQGPPAALSGASVGDIHGWALENWDLSKMIGKTQLQAPKYLYQTPKSAPEQSA